MTAPNQISSGGPVIGVQVGEYATCTSFIARSRILISALQDNEYGQSPIQNAEYFAQLEADYKSSGIVVPL